MSNSSVLVFRPPATVLPWYAERVRAIGFDVGTPSPIAIADRALATGRPLFVNLAEKEILAAFPNYPFGTFERVLPRAAAWPALDAIVAENKALYATFDFDYPEPGMQDEFAMAMHARLAATWKRLGAALVANGEPALAKECYALADQLAPRDD